MSIAETYEIVILAVLLFIGLGFFLGWISVIWQIIEEIAEKLKRKKT